jgi:hypothetical protein
MVKSTRQWRSPASRTTARRSNKARPVHRKGPYYWERPGFGYFPNHYRGPGARERASKERGEFVEWHRANSRRLARDDKAKDRRIAAAAAEEKEYRAAQTAKKMGTRGQANLREYF